MGRVRFEPSGQEARAPLGERVLDVIDELPDTGIRLGCRSALCGACRLQVLAGARSLCAPSTQERETLRELGAAEDERLGCQLRICGDDEVVLRCR